MPELVDLYAMVSRMRVLSMPKTVACADIVMRSIVETYFAPNRTVADIRELVKTGARHRSPEGLRRGGARGTARVRDGLKLTQPFPCGPAYTQLVLNALDARLQVTTVGAFRPVRFSISPMSRANAMRSASAACVS